MRQDDPARRQSFGLPRHPRYRIRRKLGSGGSSSVYLAQDLFDESQLVALKVCRQEFDPQHILREFRLLRELRHPGIARAYDFGSLPGGGAYFTMEYVTGVSLASGARALRRLGARGYPKRLLLIFLELVDSLSYLHRRGLLHLDIKPANAILTDGHLRLIDFGLFQSAAHGVEQAPRGTAFFAAPELSESGPVDARTDLYALGVTMYWCFTGRYPITGRTAGEVAHRHRHALPAPLVGLPDSLSRVVLRLLAKSPRHRFQRAEDVAHALRVELNPATIATRELPPPAEPAFGGRKRELDLFCRWYVGVERSTGPRALLVTGSAGLGKSRLLEACVTELLSSGAQIVPLRAGRDRDEDGLHDLLAKALILAPLTAGERKDCGFLLTLLGFSSERSRRKEISGSSLEALRARVFEELHRLLARRAVRPLVIVLDDVDRVDPALQDFVRRLADSPTTAGNGNRLALLMAARSAGGIAGREPADSPSSLTKMDLLPLGATDVLAILRDQDPSATTARAQALWTASGGHPGLLARLLRQGESQQGSDAARVALTLSPRTSVLASLGANARRLLVHLAAFAGPARVKDLRDILGFTVVVFDRARRELESAWLAAGSRETCYVDDGVDATLAGVFQPEELRVAHAAIGHHFAARGMRPAAAAHHLLRANNAEAGLRAAAEAVARFRSAGRLEEATQLLAEAAGKARGAARRALWEEAGDLEQECGRFDAADVLFRQALEAGSVPESERSRLLRKRGGILQRRGSGRAAREHLAEALRLAENLGDIEEQMRALIELAGLHLFSGDPSSAGALTNRALELLESSAAASLPRVARAMHGLSLRSLRGNILVRQLDYELAAVELEKGLAFARELGATSNVVLLLNQMGIAYHQSNRLAAALRVYARAERLALRLGDSAALFSVLCNTAAIRGRLGELESAASLLRRAEDLPAARRSERGRLYLLHTQGLLRKLHLEDARAVWEEAIQLARTLPDPHFEGYDRLHLLENEIDQGRWANARKILGSFAVPIEDVRLRRAVEVRQAHLEALCGHRETARTLLRGGSGADAPRDDHAGLWERVGLAAAWMELGELDTAAMCLEEAFSRFRASKQDPGAIQCLLLGADVALRRGDAALARRHLDGARRDLKVQEALAGARGSAFLLPFLEARAALLEGSLTVSRKVAEARQALPPGAFLEAAFQLELVAGASGERGAARRIRAARERFLSHVTPEDARDYSRRDHGARLGLLAPRSAAASPTGRSVAERRYDAILELRHASDYRQALSLILDAAGASRGAIFLEGNTRVAAAQGLAGRSTPSIDKLRTLALCTPPGPVGAGLGVEVRLPGGGSTGRLYVELGEQGDAADLQGFLETAGILLGTTFAPLLRRSRQLSAVEPTPARAASRTRTQPASTALESDSPRMRELLALVERTRASKLPILLVGESGVGKDHLARCIHQLSPRRSRPFVAQDCSAIPAGLLEAEIFGHEAGAFTGAREARKGYLFAADGGTFYLDNVDSLSLEVQAKLLRVLEGEAVRPLGGANTHKLDVRFIASSQRDLKPLCAHGEFRKDLFFRLSGIALHIPPLRERGEDILRLVRDLQRQVRGTGGLLELTAGAIEALKLHPWPGNVRELESVVRRLALTCDEIVGEEQVRRVVGAAVAPGAIPRWVFEGRTYDQVVEDVKRELLLHLFERFEGDIDLVARELGTTRRNVYLRFQQAGLRPTELRGDKRVTE